MMLKTLLVTLLLGPCLHAADTLIYRADFQSVPAGQVPPEVLVLDGAFAVQAEGEARFLELPGDPLETYGVLFGPAQTNDVVVCARALGTSRGRRSPAFGVGLGGANGFKLLISPGKKALELRKGDAALASTAFDWQSGHWTHFRLQLRGKDGSWRVEGKAWTGGNPEPAGWMLVHDINEAPRPGRAAIWAAPYSGTPIRFDDLELRRSAAAP